MSEDDSFNEKLAGIKKSKHSPTFRKLSLEYEKDPDIIAEEESKFETSYSTSCLHDSLLDICASAFGPESNCAQDLGYYFISSEPLVELRVKNYDLLIYNPHKKHSIFVECKSSVSKSGKIITDAYYAKKKVIANKSYLEDKIGDEIRSIEYVLCIPAHDADRLVKEIERRESNGDISEKEDGLLLVWQVDQFGGDYLQLFTRIQSRDKPHKSFHVDPDLTRVLTGRCNIQKSEVLPKFHPSTHILKKGMHIVATIVKENMRNNSLDDSNLIEFSEELVINFCTSDGTLISYDHELIGRNIASHFIREHLELQLIEPINEKPGYFKLNIQGKRIETIIHNYEQAYRRMILSKKIKESAQKKAYNKIMKDQSNLFSFEDT